MSTIFFVSERSTYQLTWERAPNFQSGNATIVIQFRQISSSGPTGQWETAAKKLPLSKTAYTFAAQAGLYDLRVEVQAPNGSVILPLAGVIVNLVQGKCPCHGLQYELTWSFSTSSV